MGGTGSKPGDENKPSLDQVAIRASNVLNSNINPRAQERAMLREIQERPTATKAASAFEGLFSEIKVPESTKPEIKNLEDLFQNLKKEIDDNEIEFDNFKKQVLDQQAESLKKINLNNEEIKSILELSNEIMKLLGNQESSLLTPIKGKRGEVDSLFVSPKLWLLTTDSFRGLKRLEYLKKVGISESEINKFYQDKMTLGDYQRKFELKK